MKTQLLQFLCNVPVQVSLLSLDTLPKDGPKGPTYFYPTTTGGFWADAELHAKIQALRVAIGDLFWICKRRACGRRKMIWDLWRGQAVGEAESKSSDTTLETQLARSLDRVKPQSPPEPIPIRAEASQTLGTGTYGPVPLASPTKRPAGGKIPLDVATREVISFVTAALKEAGEQWHDAAKQDLISTVIISATKAGYTTVWNREDAV